MSKRGIEESSTKDEHEFDTDEKLKYQFTKYPDYYKVGDILFTDSDNQEGYIKYEVILKDGKKILKELESYSMDEARDLDLEDETPEKKQPKTWSIHGSNKPNPMDEAIDRIESDERVKVGDIITVSSSNGQDRSGITYFEVMKDDEGKYPYKFTPDTDDDDFDIYNYGGKTKKSKKSRKTKKANKKSRKTKKANKKSRKTKKSNKK